MDVLYKVADRGGIVRRRIRRRVDDVVYSAVVRAELTMAFGADGRTFHRVSSGPVGRATTLASP